MGLFGFFRRRTEAQEIKEIKPLTSQEKLVLTYMRAYADFHETSGYAPTAEELADYVCEEHEFSGIKGEL